jgi:hypothetical protein
MPYAIVVLQLAAAVVADDRDDASLVKMEFLLHTSLYFVITISNIQ